MDFALLRIAATSTEWYAGNAVQAMTTFRVCVGQDACSSIPKGSVSHVGRDINLTPTMSVWRRLQDVWLTTETCVCNVKSGLGW